MGKACADCGVTLNRWQVSRKARWCSECAKGYCQTCRKPMDRARTGRRCTDCNHACRQRRASDPNHRCSACGKPIPLGVTNVYCPACDRANYLEKMRQIAKQGPRECRECGTRMPAGRRYADCKDCRREKLRRADSKPCSQCGKRVRRPGKSYCQPCASMYNRWRKDYLAGSTEARLLKPKKDYRRWQQP